MNREQKIAIIIGFAVILAVGVLLSDHFSRARQLELADATEGDAQQYAQQPVAVLTQPEEIVLPVDTKPQANDKTTSRKPAQALAKSQPAVALPPVVISQGTSSDKPSRSNQAGLGDVSFPNSSSPLANALESTSNRLTPQTGKPGIPQRFNSVVSKLRDSYNKPLPQAARVDQARPNTPATQSTPNRTPKSIVVLPTKATHNNAKTTPQHSVPIRHKVAKGETLSQIAAKYLGSAKRWRDIAKANPRVVGANGSVRQGVILLIPTSSTSPKSQASTARHAASNRTHRATTATYTVKKGDTLGEIAQKLLGSAKRYKDILKANRNLIKDADDIRVGMVLKIPAQ